MLKRRIWAYLIDFLFISLLLSMVENISFLNPRYDEYLESSENYMELLTDGELDLSELGKVVFDLNYNGSVYLIMHFGVYLAYFWGFQYWNKGQTLGKKLMHLKVVNKDDTKISGLKLLIREVILFGLYEDILGLLFINIFKANIYLIINYALATITSNITLVTIIFILFRKDNLGLHDILSKTKVVRA